MRNSIRTLALAALAQAAVACHDVTSAPTSSSAGASGTFTLSAPATLRVLRGGGGEATITLARDGGFTGSVTLAVTGAPAGLTATITPSTTTGATAALAVTTDAVPLGSVALTITARASGRPDQTTTLTVDVAASGGSAGKVTVDFSGCAADRRPVWFAYQDGDDAWTQILGADDVYRFDVGARRGGYAYVPAQGSGVLVQLATRDELTPTPHEVCVPRTGLKTVSGTLAPTGDDVVYVGLGGPNPNPEFWGPVGERFTLSGIEDGPQDLIAYRSNPAGYAPGERALIRRDQNVVDHGSLGTLDLSTAEAFAPATARVTVTGADGAPIGHGMSYRTGPRCSRYDLYDQMHGDTNLTVRGIPVERQRATDFHQLNVSSVQGTFARYAYESFHTLADRVVALPEALPFPTVTSPPGGHKRLQAALTLPAEYRNGSLQLWMGGDRGYTIVTASSAWLGAQTVTLAVPDFSGVSGWRSVFLPAPGNEVWWGLFAFGANEAAASGVCVENARFILAMLNGRR